MIRRFAGKCIGVLMGRLSVKVFLLTAVLMMSCCGLMYACMVRFAPYVYVHQVSEAEEMAYELALCMDGSHKEEAVYYIQELGDILREQTQDEYVFYIFDSSGREVDTASWKMADRQTGDGVAAVEMPVGAEEETQLEDRHTGRRIEELWQWKQTDRYFFQVADDTEEYYLIAVQNRDKESQVVGTLRKAFPFLCVLVCLMSVTASFFYAWYITCPVKKVSHISRQMAELHFGGFCPVRRTDEIGVLSDSLNTLSVKLSAALCGLQEANEKLQADIEKERQLERQRTEFFSAASHELKTPITVIKGQLEGMLYGVGRYKDREAYLAASLEEVCALEKMVQELLTISRLGTPGYAARKCRIDFGALVKERIAVYEDLFTLKELETEVSIAEGAYIEGDRWLLEKVVDNLLSNAAAYSPTGCLVRVKLWKRAEEIRLFVENTGVHIPDWEVEKLFEAFYRVDQSRSRQTGGSGLGLYIVKTVLDLHRGQIEMKNSEQGVEVVIRLECESGMALRN